MKFENKCLNCEMRFVKGSYCPECNSTDLVQIKRSALKKTQCASCPFRDAGTGRHGGIVLSPGAFEKICRKVISGTNHLCHSTDKHICYGGRELQLRVLCSKGFIEAPTNEAFDKAMRECGMEPNYSYEDA